MPPHINILPVAYYAPTLIFDIIVEINLAVSNPKFSYRLDIHGIDLDPTKGFAINLTPITTDTFWVLD